MVKVLVIGKGTLDHDECIGSVWVSACAATADPADTTQPVSFGERIRVAGNVENAAAEYAVVLIHRAHDDELSEEGIPLLSAAIAEFGHQRVGFLSSGGERRQTMSGGFPLLGNIRDAHALVRLLQRADLSAFVAQPTAERLVSALAEVVEHPTHQAAAIGVLLQVMWGVIVADSQRTPDGEVAHEVANCADVLAALGFDPIPEHLPLIIASDRATLAAQFISAVSEATRSATSPPMRAVHLSVLKTNVDHDLASPSADSVRRLRLATNEFRTFYHALIA